MHLVQRDHERAFLRRLYKDCTLNQGQIIHVIGPTASGKSVLLNDLVDQVTAFGGLHLPASGVRSEQDLPLGLINQIMSAAGLDAIEPVRALGPSQEPWSWLIPRLDELCHELKVIAARTPLLLHVDDAHLADTDSVCCLLYILRRLRKASVMAVITEQSPTPGTASEHLTTLAWLPQTTRIRLKPLSDSQVRELLTNCCGSTADDETVADLMRATGGIPALVLAALEDHRADRGRSFRCVTPVTGPTPGAAYRTAIAEYLYRNDPATLDLAKTLAVLGENRSPQRSTAYLLPYRNEEQASLDRLRATGLLEPGGFTHPMAQAAVSALVSPQERARTHLRCARLLYESDAPVAHVAWHLRYAEDVSDPWAIPFLHQAGEQALASGEISCAIDYLSSAAAFCTDPERKPRIVLTLAAILWRANPAAASRHLLRLAEDAIMGRLSSCELYALVRGLLWAGHYVEVERVLLGLPESVIRDPDPAAAIEIRITRAICASDHPEMTALVPEPLSHEEVADSPHITTMLARLNGAEALAEALVPSGGRGMGDDAEKVLTNAGLGEHMVEAVFAALSALIYTDRLDRAAYWGESLIDMPERSPLWRAQAHLLRAETALRTGELGVAHHHATIALSSMSRSSWGTAIGLPLSNLLLIAVATKNRKETARIMAEPVNEELFRSRYGLHFLYARGHHHLSDGRPEAALSDFSVCGGLMEKWGLDNPALVPWRGGAARAHLRLGDHRTAQALVYEQEAMVAPHLGRTRGIALLDLATVLTHQDRVPVLEEAVHFLDEASDRLGAARGSLDLADALEATGDAGRAPRLRERARRALVEGTVPPPGEPRALAHIPTGRSAPSSSAFDGSRPTRPDLTGAERRVARLAADGLTNRQISSNLHITISTVEQHLTRIYRKFDISDRQRIVDILAPDRDMVR